MLQSFIKVSSIHPSMVKQLKPKDREFVQKYLQDSKERLYHQKDERQIFILLRRYFADELSKKTFDEIGYDIKAIRAYENNLSFRLVDDMEKEFTFDKTLVERDVIKSLEQCLLMVSPNGMKSLRLKDFEINYLINQTRIVIKSRDYGNIAARAFLYEYGCTVLWQWSVK